MGSPFVLTRFMYASYIQPTEMGIPGSNDAFVRCVASVPGHKWVSERFLLSQLLTDVYPENRTILPHPNVEQQQQGGGETLYRYVSPYHDRPTLFHHVRTFGGIRLDTLAYPTVSQDANELVHDGFCWRRDDWLVCSGNIYAVEVADSFVVEGRSMKGTNGTILPDGSWAWLDHTTCRVGGRSTKGGPDGVYNTLRSYILPCRSEPFVQRLERLFLVVSRPTESFARAYATECMLEEVRRNQGWCVGLPQVFRAFDHECARVLRALVTEQGKPPPLPPNTLDKTFPTRPIRVYRSGVTNNVRALYLQHISTEIPLSSFELKAKLTEYALETYANDVKVLPTFKRLPCLRLNVHLRGTALGDIIEAIAYNRTHRPLAPIQRHAVERVPQTVINFISMCMMALYSEEFQYVCMTLLKHIYVPDDQVDEVLRIPRLRSYLYTLERHRLVRQVPRRGWHLNAGHFIRLCKLRFHALSNHVTGSSAEQPWKQQMQPLLDSLPHSVF
jgi:hypothetical protein